MKNLIQITGKVNLPREVEGIAKRKQGTQILAQTYEQTNVHDWYKKSINLRLCGRTLIYAENPTGGDPILVSAMRCGLRLCPSCSWIRAHRTFENVYSIITSSDFSGKQFIFLTLTVKNCRGELLESEIKRLLSAWGKLTETKRNNGFTKSFLGTFRALEVTYNPLTKTYHPHIHAMAAVEPEYFWKSNKNYIGQAKLRELWKGACGLDYLPQCRIEKVRNATGKQVAEVAKYTVKSAEYLDRPEVVEILDPALHRKRLVAYGGLFREVKKRLALQDEEELDKLPRQTVEELLQNPYIRKIIFEWKMGAYHVSALPPSADPAEWLEPGRMIAEALRRSAAAWGQGV
jgi:plasmid rolling circle replication initiator protein Rep